MKTNRFITLFVLCWLFIGNTQAQTERIVSPDNECGTVTDDDAILYEQSINREDFKRQMQIYLNGGGENRGVIQQYALQLHIVTRDDGTGGTDVEDIRNEIENFINPYYAAIDIEFVECNPELYHNSSEYYSLGEDGEDRDVAGDAMSSTYNVANVINLYYVNYANGGCGWARFPWKLPADYIVIKNSCSDNQSTTAHELGHYFGLYHTHQGGDESVTRDNSDGCWNCETNGDLLCDTPADPNLSSTASDWPSCAYFGSATDDCNSESYSPAIDNIMSYADKECRVIFSPEQKARMEVFRDNERSYLQIGCPCEKPQANCKNINVSLSALGTASITPSDVDNGSTWDCGLDSWSVSPNSFDCGDTGGNVVTLTVIDDLGWESTCEATVTIVDDTFPKITTPAADMNVECDGDGNVAQFNNWLNSNAGAAASDACGGSWSNNSAGLSDGCGATGSELVTFTYADASGNEVSTDATFTIVDDTNPSVECPADIHLPECVETASWVVISSDVCGTVNVVSDPPSGSFFAKGTTTTVTVTATDECGNKDVCTFEVTRDPDLQVDIDPVATSPLNTCALGSGANIVLGYGGGPTCTTLNAVGSGGHAPYTYQWTAPAIVPVGSFTDDNTSSPTFCAEFQTEACASYTFEVTITDIHGCTETSDIEVSVVNPLCTDGKKPKVNVCHRPNGNPSNEQTLCISSNAVGTHLNGHDDCLGTCDAICVSYSAKTVAPVVQSRVMSEDEFTISAQPNPFTSSTRIDFSASYDTEIQIIVYNISGQKVAELYRGGVEGDQSRSVVFDSGDLSPGLYFIRLIDQTGNGTTSTVILSN